MKYDIVIIGGGLAGLSFACSMSDANQKVLLVEKRTVEQLANPQPDGREIALTHLSKSILEKAGAWDLIPQDRICPLKEARVFNGESRSSLNFTSTKSSELLGYLIPNYLICKALYERAANCEAIDILTEVNVDDVVRQADSAQVSLSNGERIEASLVVAADSRFSDMRRKMGIPALMKDFSKVMILTQMEHEKSHNNTALECFHYGRTLAVLPVMGNASSIVMTVATDKVDDVMAMSEQEFSQDIEQAFNGVFGKMKQQGQRYAYPLISTYSQTFISQRFALIGDAAVGMHPVTAHGANLALRGQDILADTLKQALKQKQDIGAFEILKRYESKQIHITRLMYFGTNSVVALFTNDAPVVKQIRKAVLSFAQHFPPIKHLINRQLSQSAGKSLLPF
jgi:ubiquinone biosynthesis UbiH/UbiF/VisC/COQ6 family hydroxylase